VQFKHLQYFVALGRQEHFGRAAEACRVTQSTLSAAVRQLEKEIGAPLIERDKRFKGFTAEGKVLLEWATRVVAKREELTQRIGQLHGELVGSLVIGAIPVTLPTIGLLTTPFSRAHPTVTFKILSHTSDEIQRMLDAFTLDIGVRYLDAEPLDGVTSLPLYREHYVLLTPAGGPFHGRTQVAWREAAETPLCLLTSETQTRRNLNAIFAGVDCVPNVRAETDSVMTLCSHIKTGEWSSVVPDNFLWVFGTPPGMIALPLVDPERSFTIGAVVRRRSPMPPLVHAFVQSLQAAEIETRIRAQPRS